MAHALLELYPAMALDQYEGHEYRGKERSSIRSFFSQLRGYSVITEQRIEMKLEIYGVKVR